MGIETLKELECLSELKEALVHLSENSELIIDNRLGILARSVQLLGGIEEFNMDSSMINALAEKIKNGERETYNDLRIILHDLECGIQNLRELGYSEDSIKIVVGVLNALKNHFNYQVEL